MQITHGGETVGKCPLYPFLIRSDMNEKIAGTMLRLFEVAEKTQYS